MRALISLTTRSAMMRSRSDSSRPASALAASPIDRSQMSEIEWPSIVTASDSGLSRAPPHVGARHLAHVALDLLAGAVGLGLGVAALQVRDRRPRSWRGTCGSRP